MTPEKQRIAIAEACGWRYVRDYDPCREGSWHDSNGMDGSDPPDYPNDLNACHEMEKVFNTDEQIDSYVRYLYCLIDAPMPFEHMPLFRQFEIARATAPQRCEAFLRTLCKWEDAQ